MSANKRLCLRNLKIKRKLFSDRICDDLCEVLLKYLSFEDRFRYECVSKQFQRCVYKTQYDLSIDCRFLKYHSKNKCHYMVNRFRMVFKKCPDISKISFDDAIHWDTCYRDYYQVKYYPKIMQIIIKYCNNLCEIMCDLSKLNKKVYQNFYEKFRNQIKYFTDNDSGLTLLTLERMKQFANIEQLFLCHSSLDYDCFQILNELNFSNLKKLDINFDIRDLEKLSSSSFEKSIDSIKYLKIHINKDYESESLETYKNFILRAKNLNHLYFSNKYHPDNSNVKNMCNLLSSINIDSLNYVKFKTDVSKLDENSFKELISSFKQFNHLKRLVLDIDFFSNKVYNKFSLKWLYGLNELIYLDIYFYISYYNGIPVNPTEMLTDFDSNLPKLKNFKFCTNELIMDATQQTADILCRHPTLNSVSLFTRKQNICDYINDHFIEKRENLRISTFDSDFKCFSSYYGCNYYSNC